MTTQLNPDTRGGTFVAEWTKLRTLRSTWTTIAGIAAMSVFLGAVVPATQVSQWDDMSAAQRADFDPISTVLVGVLFATVIAGALGIRSVTNEYSTGMIRVTFAAIPRRRRVIMAKAVIITAITLPVALASQVIAFAVGQQVLSSEDVDVAFSAPGATRAIVLGAFAVSAVAALGVGLGALLKRTAAATTALSVAIIGSQLFSVAVPEAGRKYLPGSALEAIVSGDQASDLLTPQAGLASLAIYAVIALAIAASRITRRDA